MAVMNKPDPVAPRATEDRACPTTSQVIDAAVHWQGAAQAAAYRRSRTPRKFGRYWQEEAILVNWLDGLPRGAKVLDSPCGTGRWIPTLTGRGYRYHGCDISAAMVAEASSVTAPPAVEEFAVADARRLPYPDDHFDCVIVWRFLHHVADAATREAVLREAARVSRGPVLVSFHHVFSWTYLFRFYLRRKLRGFAQDGRGCTANDIRREAGNCGLDVAEFASFGKYRSINWFAKLVPASPRPARS